MIITCLHPYTQQAVDGFIHEQLGLDHGEYIHISTSGGILFFSNMALMPMKHRHFHEELEFLFDKEDGFSTLTEIVAVNHEYCSRYRQMYCRHGESFLEGFPDLDALQRHHLNRFIGQVKASRYASRVQRIRKFSMYHTNPERTVVRFTEIEHRP